MRCRLPRGNRTYAETLSLPLCFSVSLCRIRPRRRKLAAISRADRARRLGFQGLAHHVERVAERQVEDADPWQIMVVAGDLGQAGLGDQRDGGWARPVRDLHRQGDGAGCSG